jgi:hypothetical protein
MINNELIKRMLIGACTPEEKNNFFLSLLDDIKIEEILSREIDENKLTGREWPVPAPPSDTWGQPCPVSKPQ